MAATRKTLAVYGIVGLCTVGFLLMAYSNQALKFSVTSLNALSKEQQIRFSIGSSPDTEKSDLPVRYMTEETAMVLEGINSSRKFPLKAQVRKTMLKNRIHDDYRFCLKTADFVGPYDYLQSTKNPCWYTDMVLRCVPHFYLAGFSKCGTTDLFARISSHPHVLQFNGKEKHWLDYVRYYPQEGKAFAHEH